jgi:hypothetical protein
MIDREDVADIRALVCKDGPGRVVFFEQGDGFAPGVGVALPAGVLDKPRRDRSGAGPDRWCGRKSSRTA